MKFSSHKVARGFSILEANVAVALTLVSLAGCFAANANFMALLKSAEQAAAASQSIQERVEQMRIANWIQITDVNYLQSNLVSSPTASELTLPGCVETLTVSLYPPPASGATASTKITRTDTQVVVESTDNTLKDAAVVKVDWLVSWKPRSDQTTRSRNGTVLVAKGGIVK
jgi:Tfp pilus assembly protein PilV